MNLPLDKIHSVRWSWGWLVLPWFGGWVSLTKDHGLRLARYGTFHNCRVTGVY